MLQGESSRLASPPELTQEECVGESPGAPFLLAAAKSCRAWQCKPIKNCTRGRRCTAPGSWQSGKALLPPSAGSPSNELSSLAIRFNPVSARFCASFRAKRGNDPSREPVVLRLEIPVKVLECLISASSCQLDFSGILLALRGHLPYCGSYSLQPLCPRCTYILALSGRGGEGTC